MASYRRLTARLVGRQLSPLSLVGFTLANFVGLGILLLGVQFYQDARGLFEQQGKFLSGDYMVLSKPIKALGSIRGRGNTFNQTEIEHLRTQPFAQAVGAFTPSAFRVTAGLNIGLEMYTYLFFESVPDEFLDIKPERWSFDPSSDEVPIILPRSYLSLYNSAFSQSQGLPQLSEQGIGRLPLSIQIGEGYTTRLFRGVIVGFSDRLNTIVAPESFVRWGNEHYAAGKHQEATRLILKTNNPSDKELLSYLSSHSYQVEAGATEAGQAHYMLRVVSSVVAAVGLLISLLSIYLLILSVYLLLQRGAQQLEDLLLLGYTTMQVAHPYIWLCAGLSLGVWLLATIAVWSIRGLYTPLLESIGSTIDSSGIVPMLGAGLALTAVSLLWSAVAIYRRVRQIPAYPQKETMRRSHEEHR